ncbi:MAG: ABC transporter substrate-binding protein, partial [Actinomycetota bacterium]|nr:ABC transporter substrate-binding protein [Actinomycetota bacterium]
MRHSRTKWRSSARGAVALGSMSLLLAACGSGGSAGSAGGGSATTSPSSSGSGSTTGTGSGTITWWASPISQTGIRASLIRSFEKAYPKIKVNLQSAPTSSNQNEATLTTQISGGAGPDVYMGDVIWPAQFAAHGLAVPLSGKLPSSYWSGFAPGLVKGATYKGKVYGAPFFMDQGFLYYRKDLLTKNHMSVPKTWSQLVADSKKLQASHQVKYGYVWQGASYEGLTCNWMEIASDAGGKVLNSSGTKAVIDSPASLKALTFMRGLISSGVSPTAETTYQEPNAMQAFDAGNAAFLRNWDYAYSNANTPSDSSVVGKVGVAPLPTFSGHPYPGYSTIGGWNLYINPHSKNMAADVTFIKYLTSPAAQTILATQYSEIPTLQSVRVSPSEI